MGPPSARTDPAPGVVLLYARRDATQGFSSERDGVGGRASDGEESDDDAVSKDEPPATTGAVRYPVETLVEARFQGVPFSILLWSSLLETVVGL